MVQVQGKPDCSALVGRAGFSGELIFISFVVIKFRRERQLREESGDCSGS